MNSESKLGESEESNAPGDWDCVTRVQKGDTDFFEILVRRHQKTVFNLVYRMLGDYDDAAEVAQEVFLSAYRSIGQFRGDASFATWIYRITLNHANTRRKSSAARQRITVPLDGINPVDNRTPDPPTAVERRETRSLVQNALNCLSPEHCEIIVLIDMQGSSYEEAAETIGIKIETVKTRLHRARQALKAQLAPVFRERRVK